MCSLSIYMTIFIEYLYWKLCFLKDYEDYYQYEEEINRQLNVFSVNMKTAYGGLNTVQAQIGYHSDAGKGHFLYGFSISMIMPDLMQLFEEEKSFDIWSKESNIDIFSWKVLFVIIIGVLKLRNLLLCSICNILIWSFYKTFQSSKS